MGVPDPSGKKDILRGTSRPIVRYLHLVGLIGRSHFFDQPHAAVRELRRFILCDRWVTILTSSAKSNISVSRSFGRSFTKRRKRSGPITEPCGTPLRIGMAPECSPPTRTLETRPERYASIQSTTSPRPKDFVVAKRNLWLTESKALAKQGR